MLFFLKPLDITRDSFLSLAEQKVLAHERSGCLDNVFYIGWHHVKLYIANGPCVAKYQIIDMESLRPDEPE